MNPQDNNRQDQSSTSGLLHDANFPSGIIKPRMIAADPTQAEGDLYYVNDSGIFQRLAAGSASQVLTMTNGVPTWATPAVAAGINFATSGQQADFNTSSASYVDATGATVTIAPTASAHVDALITGDYYDSTSTAQDVFIAVLIDGTIVQYIQARPSTVNFRVPFAVSGQAIVASGSRIIKLQIHAGGDTIHVDGMNVTVVWS